MCEIWSNIKGGEKKLLNFKKKMLKMIIYGPLYTVDSRRYERRKNDDIQKLYNKQMIRNFLSSNRLEWARYVRRTEWSLIRKSIVQKLNDNRPLGRPYHNEKRSYKNKCHTGYH